MRTQGPGPTGQVLFPLEQRGRREDGKNFTRRRRRNSRRGLNAPAASGQGPAGTTEGGDHLPIAAGRGVKRTARKFHS
jgi:hypothetical protein